jgi:hypothetical protein
MDTREPIEASAEDSTVAALAKEYRPDDGTGKADEF